MAENPENDGFDTPSLESVPASGGKRTGVGTLIDIAQRTGKEVVQTTGGRFEHADSLRGIIPLDEGTYVNVVGVPRTEVERLRREIDGIVKHNAASE